MFLKKVRIEKMTEQHLDAVSELEKKCFSKPWSRDSLESELNNENSLFFVALKNDKLLGYIGMNVVVDEGYIFNLAVKKLYRHRGIGSSLVRELVKYAKENKLQFLTLEVRQSNWPARSLYSKLGFTDVGQRVGYYSNPTENAILMKRYFTN